MIHDKEQLNKMGENIDLQKGIKKGLEYKKNNK